MLTRSTLPWAGVLYVVALSASMCVSAARPSVSEEYTAKLPRAESESSENTSVGGMFGCSAPRPFIHGQWVSQDGSDCGWRKGGSNCQGRCDDGYELLGDREIHCSFSCQFPWGCGWDWAGKMYPIAACFPAGCHQPPEAETGEAAWPEDCKDTPHGGRCVTKCVQGHSGFAMRVCQFGTWVPRLQSATDNEPKDVPSTPHDTKRKHAIALAVLDACYSIALPDTGVDEAQEKAGTALVHAAQAAMRSHPDIDVDTIAVRNLNTTGLGAFVNGRKNTYNICKRVTAEALTAVTSGFLAPWKWFQTADCRNFTRQLEAIAEAIREDTCAFGSAIADACEACTVFDSSAASDLRVLWSLKVWLQALHSLPQAALIVAKVIAVLLLIALLMKGAAMLGTVAAAQGRLKVVGLHDNMAAQPGHSQVRNMGTTAAPKLVKQQVDSVVEPLLCP